MFKRSKIWLPIIANSPPNPADLFLDALITHPKQERLILAQDICLKQMAQGRSLQIAEEFAHCFQGDCVNRLVRRVCILPKEYAENGNSIESIVGGAKYWYHALEALLRSTKHADHLLGRNDFFRQQKRIGVAYHYAPGTTYEHYYVILISK